MRVSQNLQVQAYFNTAAVGTDVTLARRRTTLQKPSSGGSQSRKAALVPQEAMPYQGRAVSTSPVQEPYMGRQQKWGSSSQKRQRHQQSNSRSPDGRKSTSKKGQPLQQQFQNPMTIQARRYSKGGRSGHLVLRDFQTRDLPNQGGVIVKEKSEDPRSLARLKVQYNYRRQKNQVSTEGQEGGGGEVPVLSGDPIADGLLHVVSSERMANQSSYREISREASDNIGGVSTVPVTQVNTQRLLSGKLDGGTAAQGSSRIGVHADGSKKGSSIADPEKLIVYVNQPLMSNQSGVEVGGSEVDQNQRVVSGYAGLGTGKRQAAAMTMASFGIAKGVSLQPQIARRHTSKGTLNEQFPLSKFESAKSSVHSSTAYMVRSSGNASLQCRWPQKNQQLTGTRRHHHSSSIKSNTYGQGLGQRPYEPSQHGWVDVYQHQTQSRTSTATAMGLRNNGKLAQQKTIGTSKRGGKHRRTRKGIAGESKERKFKISVDLQNTTVSYSDQQPQILQPNMHAQIADVEGGQEVLPQVMKVIEQTGNGLMAPSRNNVPVTSSLKQAAQPSQQQWQSVSKDGGFPSETNLELSVAQQSSHANLHPRLVSNRPSTGRIFSSQNSQSRQVIGNAVLTGSGPKINMDHSSSQPEYPIGPARLLMQESAESCSDALGQRQLKKAKAVTSPVAYSLDYPKRSFVQKESTLPGASLVPSLQTTVKYGRRAAKRPSTAVSRRDQAAQQKQRTAMATAPMAFKKLQNGKIRKGSPLKINQTSFSYSRGSSQQVLLFNKTAKSTIGGATIQDNIAHKTNRPATKGRSPSSLWQLQNMSSSQAFNRHLMMRNSDEMNENRAGYNAYFINANLKNLQRAKMPCYSSSNKRGEVEVVTGLGHESEVIVEGAQTSEALVPVDCSMNTTSAIRWAGDGQTKLDGDSITVVGAGEIEQHSEVEPAGQYQNAQIPSTYVRDSNYATTLVASRPVTQAQPSSFGRKQQVASLTMQRLLALKHIQEQRDFLSADASIVAAAKLQSTAAGAVGLGVRASTSQSSGFTDENHLMKSSFAFQRHRDRIQTQQKHGMDHLVKLYKHDSSSQDFLAPQTVAAQSDYQTDDKSPNNSHYKARRTSLRKEVISVLRGQAVPGQLPNQSPAFQANEAPSPIQGNASVRVRGNPELPEPLSLAIGLHQNQQAYLRGQCDTLLGTAKSHGQLTPDSHAAKTTSGNHKTAGEETAEDIASKGIQTQGAFNDTDNPNYDFTTGLAGAGADSQRFSPLQPLNSGNNAQTQMDSQWALRRLTSNSQTGLLQGQRDFSGDDQRDLNSVGAGDMTAACELSQAQLLLLDQMNLQSIIDNKNMAHAVTALDLLRMEGQTITAGGQTLETTLHQLSGIQDFQLHHGSLYPEQQMQLQMAILEQQQNQMALVGMFHNTTGGSDEIDSVSPVRLNQIYSAKNRKQQYMRKKQPSYRERASVQQSLSPKSPPNEARIKSNNDALFKPDQAAVKSSFRASLGASPEDKKPLPLRVPQFTAQLSTRKYNFSPKQAAIEESGNAGRLQIHDKIEMYRKVHEARLLLNALPQHVRDAEIEKARLQQSLLGQQTGLFQPPFYQGVNREQADDLVLSDEQHIAAHSGFGSNDGDVEHQDEVANNYLKAADQINQDVGALLSVDSELDENALQDGQENKGREQTASPRNPRRAMSRNRGPSLTLSNAQPTIAGTGAKNGGEIQVQQTALDPMSLSQHTFSPKEYEKITISGQVEVESNPLDKVGGSLIDMTGEYNVVSGQINFQDNNDTSGHEAKQRHSSRPKSSKRRKGSLKRKKASGPNRSPSKADIMQAHNFQSQMQQQRVALGSKIALVNGNEPSNSGLASVQALQAMSVLGANNQSGPQVGRQDSLNRRSAVQSQHDVVSSEHHTFMGLNDSRDRLQNKDVGLFNPTNQSKISLQDHAYKTSIIPPPKRSFNQVQVINTSSGRVPAAALINQSSGSLFVNQAPTTAPVLPDTLNTNGSLRGSQLFLAGTKDNILSFDAHSGTNGQQNDYP